MRSADHRQLRSDLQSSLSELQRIRYEVTSMRSPTDFASAAFNTASTLPERRPSAAPATEAAESAHSQPVARLISSSATGTSKPHRLNYCEGRRSDSLSSQDRSAAITSPASRDWQTVGERAPGAADLMSELIDNERLLKAYIAQHKAQTQQHTE